MTLSTKARGNQQHTQLWTLPIMNVVGQNRTDIASYQHFSGLGQTIIVILAMILVMLIVVVIRFVVLGLLLPFQWRWSKLGWPSTPHQLLVIDVTMFYVVVVSVIGCGRSFTVVVVVVVVVVLAVNWCGVTTTTTTRYYYNISRGCWLSLYGFRLFYASQL